MTDHRTQSPSPAYAMAAPYSGGPFAYGVHAHASMQGQHLQPQQFAPHGHQISMHQLPPHIQPYPGASQQLLAGPQPQFSTSTALYEAATQGTQSGEPRIGSLADSYAARGVTRLPPILQVEKQHVTTSATQAASASRRRNDACFKCPVPGCGSTFTRRFNLRGHLRSHTEERPFLCEWPGCGKGFARQHDCKRHQALHTTKSGSHACAGCGKTFSRMDALNRHLRSDGGAECREIIGQQNQANALQPSAAGAGASPGAAASGSGARRSADSGSERSSRTPSVGTS